MSSRLVSSGELCVEIEVENRLLTRISFREAPKWLNPADLTRILDELKAFSFSFDGAPPFFQKIWNRLQQIPFGKTMTYGDLARAVGSPGAARAVGGACRANRLPLLVPCHRVVAAQGLGGFTGGLDWKRCLLAAEAAGKLVSGAPKGRRSSAQGNAMGIPCDM